MCAGTVLRGAAHWSLGPSLPATAVPELLCLESLCSPGWFRSKLTSSPRVKEQCELAQGKWLLAQDPQQERIVANDSICGRSHRDVPGLVISVFHHCTPPLPVPQTGYWECGLGLVGLGRLFSCSRTEVKWSFGPLGDNSE